MEKFSALLAARRAPPLGGFCARQGADCRSKKVRAAFSNCDIMRRPAVFPRLRGVYHMTANNKIIKHLFLFVLILAFFGIFYFENQKASGVGKITDAPKAEKEIIADKKKIVKIGDGDTYGILMERAGVGALAADNIYKAAADNYDLAKIRAGRALELIFEKNTDNLKELVYKIDSEKELSVRDKIYFGGTATTSEWTAEVRPINYEVKIVTKEGEVKSSMYAAALENNIDERAIIAFANAFQWTIDFAMDPRAGDKFKFVYEERYLDGEYVMPGKILAGYYINAGKKYEIYYFKETDENAGYFDAEGNSVQKMFLKAPLAFKYISSGFTTGRRYVKAFNVSTGHRAIDYAAKYGTPVRSVGNGTVVFSGWNGPYGYTVKVRHNGTYQTKYSHMSKLAVRRGAKVKQGDVVGYVGSTGFSTGAHLHYEMKKNGVKINPLKEILPPGKPIKKENRDRFFAEIEKWQEYLD